MTIKESHPFKRMLSRLFPKKYVTAPLKTSQWDHLDASAKKELAQEYLYKGEIALLEGNLHALSLFESASLLDGENPSLWYRQGLAFFEYGSQEGREKALLLASKYFKVATDYNPNFFDGWVAWGNTLLELGRFHVEHHFLVQAKEKYQKAIAISSNKSAHTLGELYWDYGRLWLELADHSEEALDLRFAIDAFQESLKHQKAPSAEFLSDLGSAFLSLALLVNDARLFSQAIESFQEATIKDPIYFEGWLSLADAYSQLYLNTMDERLVQKASDAFSHATKLCPEEIDAWISWAELLASSGRLTQSTKLLQLSVEKCRQAAKIDAENGELTAVWVTALSHLGELSGRLDLLIDAEHKILKATDTFPDDPEAWHAYGICCAALGKYYEDAEYYELAIEKLQTALSMDRSAGEHWYTLANIHKLYAELTGHEDLLERGTRFFAKALDLLPSCPAVLFDAASCWLLLSDYTEDAAALEKAISFFELLLQNHKEGVLHHPEWLFEYALSLKALALFSNEESSVAKAIELFTHVLLIDPDFPKVHRELALCYVELGHFSDESEFYKRAAQFFQISVKNDEENEETWLDWGVSLIHLAHHTIDTEVMNHLYWDAEQKIHRAGQLGNPSAYYHLACLYSILGRLDEAMEFIEKSLAAHALPSIDEMLDDEWLDNLSKTESFARFLNALESKLQSKREE